MQDIRERIVNAERELEQFRAERECIRAREKQRLAYSDSRVSQYIDDDGNSQLRQRRRGSSTRGSFLEERTVPTMQREWC